MKNINIPDNLEDRVEKLEQKADELMPGDYTVEVNLFRDDTGRDAHVKAVHNHSENYREILHEGDDELTTSGAVVWGGLKIPARIGD